MGRWAYGKFSIFHTCLIFFKNCMTDKAKWNFYIMICMRTIIEELHGTGKRVSVPNRDVEMGILSVLNYNEQRFSNPTACNVVLT